MKVYETIQDLFGELDTLNWDAAVFTNPASWSANPQQTEVLYLEGDDELEDVVASSHLPKIANARGMRQLLDVETLRDIVSFERRRNPNASSLDLIRAVDYYRENDDFCDPGF